MARHTYSQSGKHAASPYELNSMPSKAYFSSLDDASISQKADHWLYGRFKGRLYMDVFLYRFTNIYEIQLYLASHSLTQTTAPLKLVLFTLSVTDSGVRLRSFIVLST